MLTRARHVLAKARSAVLSLGSSRLARALPWISLAAGFEAYGRWSQNDGLDAAGLVGLVAVMVWFHSDHDEWLSDVWHQRWEPRLRAWTAPWRIRYGVDLREAPALPSKEPRAWLITWAAVLVAAACVFASLEHWPGHARHVLRETSGLVWLLALFGLWGTLLLGVFFLGFLTSTVLREHLLALGIRGRGIVAWALFCGGIACLALPLQACLLALVGFGLLNTATDLLLRPCLKMIWRRSDGDPGQLFWARGQLWSAAGNSGLTALTLTLVLLSCGDQLFGSGSEATAITNLWGMVFAKTSTFALGVFAFSSTVQLLGERLSDPAHKAPGLVLIHAAGRRQRASLRASLKDGGFVTFFKGMKSKVDLELRMDEEADPFELVLQRNWPLRVQPSHLADSRLHDILDRRVVIQRRRGFYRGLRRVMRAGCERKYEQGCGFWLAPHLWYVPAMTRDEYEGLSLIHISEPTRPY